MNKVAVALRLPFFVSILIVFMISCNNELKISVFEPLPSAILQKYSQKDSTFLTFYNEVRQLADSVYISASISPEFSGLKYNSMLKLNGDFTREFKKLQNDGGVKDDWRLKFGDDIDKFKSDSLRFSNYIKENDYHNFVEIEVSRIYEQTVWVRQNNMVDLIFTAQNGHGIRKISGYVYFLPKEVKFDPLKSYYPMEKQAYFSFSGFSKGEFKDSALDIQRKLSDLVDLPVEIVKQKYNIYFWPTELVTEEKYIDVSFEEVPFEMVEVFRGEYSYYNDVYITMYINENYRNFDQYVDELAFSSVKNTYPLEAKFLEEGWRRYNESQLKKLNEE